MTTESPEKLARVNFTPDALMRQKAIDGQGWYPVELFVNGFEDLGHKLPATDAHVLRWLARTAFRKHQQRNVYASPLFAEIGSFVGTTTTILAEFGAVDCFDVWKDTGSDDPINEFYRQHNVAEVFHRNVARAGRKERIFAWAMPADHFEAHATRRYDLIFIDASHEYDDVKRDIAEATKAIHRDGGILCGHDYGYFPGVTKAVDEIKPDGIMGLVWWKFC